MQDVLWRVGSSFIGPLKPDFMEVTMTSPDLYGPFWVATTLIFVTAGGQEERKGDVRASLKMGFCFTFVEHLGTLIFGRFRR